MKASETFERVRRQPAFGRLVADVEAVVGPGLAPYIAELGDDFEPTAAKAIKDAVWGMIALTPHEVVVLDSPPMQRLRRIRQLGVTYITYSSFGMLGAEGAVVTAGAGRAGGDGSGG